MGKDISKMNVQELKALAYDMSVQIGSLQTDLNTINTRIAQLVNQPVEEKKEDAKDKS